SADREAEHIRLVQTKGSAEGDRVGAHLLERRRDLAGAAGNARVVEQDHLTVASEAIRHRRVPVIHGADVVLVEDERHAAGLAESAVGEADSLGLDELCRRGLVGIDHDRRSLITQSRYCPTSRVWKRSLWSRLRAQDQSQMLPLNAI